MNQAEYDVVVQFRDMKQESMERPTGIPDLVWASCLGNGWLRGEARFISLDKLPPPAHYHLAIPKGSNALNEFEKNAKEKADQHTREENEKIHFAKAVRRGWLKFVLGLLAGWLLGGFTPQTVFSFIRNLIR